MTKKERATALFCEGYNCAQAVFIAFAEDRMPTQQAAALASSFGGGMGGMREVCGAVSGMILAYGYLQGYSDPKDSAAKQAHYKAVQEMMTRFKEERGSYICRTLLGLDDDKPRMPQERTPAYYDKRPCPGLVGCAAEILEEKLKDTAN